MRSRPNHRYTTQDLKYIREHCRDTPESVAAAIGAPRSTVEVYMRKCRNGTFDRQEYPPKYYYALYLRKTDELHCSGTAQECADALGIKLHSFYVMIHKITHGLIKKWEILIEPYEEEEEE